MSRKDTMEYYCPMEIYKVGGAVRDALLGLAVTDVDWVIVGASPVQLTQLGFKPVGKDFPVFLHPDTGEEYALARTERKTGAGYHGFSFHAAADVTLEEDLARRDLTINAMAMNESGEIIDPFNGKEDLQAGILRHVSPAFVEDPVRVLRLARLAARFAARGFRIAADTQQLLMQMVANGEVSHLRPERVWQETAKALGGPSPRVFFEVLRDCGALTVIFPEIDALFGVPQPARWHPEIDTGLHTLMALEQSEKLSASPEVRFAVLTHDLGKGTTPAAMLPKHQGHEERSVELIAGLCQRLPVPRRYFELAVIVARFHGLVHRAQELKPGTVLQLLEHTDALRRGDRYHDFLLACEADARGRTGLEDQPYPQGVVLRAAREVANTVQRSDVDAGLTGNALGEALRGARLLAIKAYLAEQITQPPP
jgi:tRNA nucleotidyltransferase (CCA-adding enzyme)